MGIAERSRARVEELLSELEVAYDSVPVNQTTLALSGERYERAREQYADRSVDTYVELRNDAGEVLHVREDGSVGLPGTVGDPADSLEEAVRQAVGAQAGVDLVIDGVSEVTIVGLSNADDEDAAVLYRLLVVFEADYAGGDLAENAEWRAARADPDPATV